jgi:hypothetical protein
MDSHRSFEFDRYPFDETPGREQPADSLDDRQAYYAEDVIHGMETVEAKKTLREGSVAFEQPR